MVNHPKNNDACTLYCVRYVALVWSWWYDLLCVLELSSDSSNCYAWFHNSNLTSYIDSTELGRMSEQLANLIWLQYQIKITFHIYAEFYRIICLIFCSLELYNISKMFCSFSLGDFNGPIFKLAKLKLMNIPITGKSKSHCFSNTVIVVAYSQLKAVYTPQQAALSNYTLCTYTLLVSWARLHWFYYSGVLDCIYYECGCICFLSN